jgi:hypothetical protein
VKFVPAKRVKLPAARESLASEPEIRLRRVGDLFHFTSCEQDISQCATAHYFTFAARRIFHCQATDTTKRAGCSHGEQPAFLME